MNNYLNKISKKKKCLYNSAILTGTSQLVPGEGSGSVHTVGPDPGPAWFPFSIGQWAAVPLKGCLILEPAVVCCRPEHGVLISIIVLLLKPGSVAS